MIKIAGEKVIFKEFPNHETLLKEHIPLIKSSLLNKDSPINIKFKYIDDKSLMELYILKQEIDEKFPNQKTHLQITYFPYSRMDRGSNSTCFTLKHISKFINDLKFDSISIGEPHSDVCINMVNNAYAEWYTRELLLDCLSLYDFNPSIDAVLFPDKGARKRYGNILANEIPNGCNIIVGEKERDFETGRIESLQLTSSKKTARNVIIIDDLCSYGGTFIKALDALRCMNINKAILAVGNCEESIIKGELLKHDLLEKVYTTNSIINRVYEIHEPKLKIKAVI